MARAWAQQRAVRRLGEGSERTAFDEAEGKAQAARPGSVPEREPGDRIHLLRRQGPRLARAVEIAGAGPPGGENLKCLGLGRPGKTVVVANTPSFRGAIKKVLHLVTVEEVDNG